ncbi:MAG: recombinase family protein [Anaerolineae bacterium]|nr:recombinase family protein [Anaerolineae bacterium]
MRQIYAWYTQSEPMTIQEITDRLNRDGLQQRRRKCWRSSLIGNILRQTQYTGLAYYNRTEKVYHEVGRLRKIGHGKRLCPVVCFAPQKNGLPFPSPAFWTRISGAWHKND